MRPRQRAAARSHLRTLMAKAPLAAVSQGMEGVFMLLPPGFDAKPGFSEVRAPVDALRSALTAARPDNAVVPSTIGAQATPAGPSDSTQHHGSGDSGLYRCRLISCARCGSWRIQASMWLQHTENPTPRMQMLDCFNEGWIEF